MFIFNRYVNGADHVWYNSSNVIYTKCYDSKDAATKVLKAVFKNGATYLYRNVSVEDYLTVKLAESTGKEFNRVIVSKYKDSYARLQDTDIADLDNLRESLSSEAQIIQEGTSKLAFHIESDESGRFSITLNDRRLFSATDNQFSIYDLFASLCIPYSFEKVESCAAPESADAELISLING